MQESKLSPETLKEIESYILKRLPAVLEQDPNFVLWIEGLLAEKFPKRDELARMLNEIQEQRRESRQQIRQMDDRLGRVEQELKEHRTEIRQEFGQVNEKLATLDHNIEEHRSETRQEFDKVNNRLTAVEQELQTHRRETKGRFEQVDQRFDRIENEMRAGFDELHRAIDRLGGRWGIRNERVFRQTVRELLEGSFDAHVQERHIDGGQFDCIITNGHHILIEIAASVGPKILERLERKRQLYIDEIGIVPHRFLLAVGSIHSRRAEAVRTAGFEVIEPELDEE